MDPAGVCHEITCRFYRTGPGTCAKEITCSGYELFQCANVNKCNLGSPVILAEDNKINKSKLLILIEVLLILNSSKSACK